VLNNLVIGVFRSSAIDRRCSRILLDSDGVLADVLYILYQRNPSEIKGVPPNQTEIHEFVCMADKYTQLTILESARAEAVNAFGLVGADDDVRQSGSLLKQEDGFVVATFILAGALCGCQWRETGLVRDTHSARSTIEANVTSLDRSVHQIGCHHSSRNSYIE
jgi:hypothetical protein